MPEESSDMNMKSYIAASAALFASTFFPVPADAESGITEREKRDCQVDYHKYCSEYGLGTNALRACMSRNIKKVSHVCVGALVAAGEMSQAQADKLRASKKKPTAKKKSTSKKYTSSKKKH